ncbi:GatB/YqeY domain-containing protein [Pelistega europaea]|uniref:GatB/YqeY domain-containing protein n=1 Tax=Pelistega europaea TaxID=106147 RepID=A0A7Y4P5B0_9BURK|nr:GatB/YqeY domain-containing protein [Pelistega europaea]NOL50326.1 GatB/YqeY domain-containing protein [Pelistega europaea]
MSLKETIMNSVKEAMRAKQTARLATLRFLQAAIKQKEVDERIELDDAQVLAIIEKQIKQRKESIAAFEQAGRAETAEAEKAELAVLSEFLPEQASDEELAAEVAKAVAELASQGVTGAPAMGKAMAILKPKLAGRADMGKVSQLLKAALA